MDPYELVDADSLHRALQTFSREARRKGDDLQRRGAITAWEVTEPGIVYGATVQDERPYQVELFWEDDFADDGEWFGDCNCDQELECEHIYAAMKELLAQKSASAVRNLSAGVLNPSASFVPRIAKGSSETKPEDLFSLLTAALQRPLTKAEAQFVRKVQSIYQRCRLYRSISSWDFEELGLPLKNTRWDGFNIWPAFPSTEHEFWLYLANAAQEHGASIPAFMEPVSDVSDVRQRLAKWRRAAEVDQWKNTLKAFAQDAASSHPVAPGETDLRLVIGPKEAWLEMRRPGASDFELLKQAQARLLGAAWQRGNAPFTAEGELLWHGLARVIEYTLHFNWAQLAQEELRVLAHAIRLAPLQSRIVTPAGGPLARPPEPLRWTLVSATADEDDYRVRLTQADGSPLPHVLAVLPGSPALYLTPLSVFVGPRASLSVLNPRTENRIPAPALETEAGLELINQLGVEMPTRLSARIRSLPYTINIHCELRPSWSGSNNEDCIFRVKAEASDGRCLSWMGHNWLDESSKVARKSGRDGEMITRYDVTTLAQARASLEPLQLKVDNYGKGLVTRVTRKFPELFANWLKSLPPEFNIQLAGDLASLANGTVAGQVKLDVTEAEIDWFDLRVVLNVSDATLTKGEVQLLLKAKGNYVRLAGKGWRRLQFDLSAEEDERLARLGLSARELSAEPQRLHALQLADDAAKTFLPEQQVEALQRRASEIKARVTPPLPAGLQASLRPYQLEGFHFLAYLSTNRFGGILADDMGLGKTVQTLAWLLWLTAEKLAARSPDTGRSAPTAEASLVVCPKSVMDNWRAEAARFSPSLRVKVWSASELDNFQEQLGSADVHVLNYNQLRSLGESLVSVRWRAVILDEGQYIKNPSSQTAQVARALRADHRLILSGTPIENRLLDLWSLMAFVMPGVLGSRAQFGKLYEPKGDPFARRRLASRVRPFLLRRTKGQVAKDLPDRIEEDLFCEMEGEQKTLYRAELKRAQQLLLGIKTQKELAQQQFHFLVSLLRLRQICCHPRLHYPDSKAPSAKTEALLEQLEPLMDEGQKVLVFSQFVELLDVLRPELKERGWPVFYLAGDTENRGELVSQFQSAPGAAVFLISLKAGGFGLNLTAASYVVLFDPWWNPAVENQAIDRTHRIGQVNKVIAYRLLIKDSIEEKIRELQKKKSALAQDVLGEERFGQSLSIDDLRFLFAD